MQTTVSEESSSSKDQNSSTNPVITLLAKAIEHSEAWAKVWFGLIFLGSIFNATAARFFPENVGISQLLICLATGFSLGLIAKLRGRWL